MNIRRRRTLQAGALALALLALAAWLGSLGDGQVAPIREPIVYPRNLPRGRGPVVKAPPSRPETEAAQDDAGPRLPVPSAALPRLGTPGGTALQRAVAAPGKGFALFEFGAIRHSELARKMMRCREQQFNQRLAEARDRLGIDLTEDIEQIGMSGDVMAVGGRLGGLELPGVEGPGERYGDEGRLFELPLEKPVAQGAVSPSATEPAAQPSTDESPKGAWLARVGDELLLFGDSKEDLQHAIDRAEGREPAADPPPGAADVSAMLSADDLADMMGGGDSEPGGPMAELAHLAKGVGLRMNVEDHVALSMDIDTADMERAEQLQAAMRTGVTLLRQKMRRDGEERAAWLLDQARIHDPTAAKLGLDLAVPGAFLLRGLGCDEQGRPLSESTGLSAADAQP